MKGRTLFMRRLWLSIALLAVLILSACNGTSTKSEEQTMQCTLYNVIPDAIDPASVKLPAINDKDWSRGPENAILTLLVYSDFQCPYCSMAGRILKELEVSHPDEVRVIYRHFPLPSHDKALIAAQAAEGQILGNA